MTGQLRHYRLFAYGSNLYPQRLRSRLRHWNGRFQLAALPNHELRFNKRSLKYVAAANVVPHPTRQVRGILIEVNDADLQAMDKCEGYPVYYDRIWTGFRLADGSHVEGYVYRATPEWVEEGKRPIREYLDYVTRGASACGLPPDYIRAIAQLGSTHFA
jgi:gamma-glutamylcyclotransferase (GGCT)/AIG2-like uncharacterized protein YtfP